MMDENETRLVVDAAAELLKAAILLADIASAMPKVVMVSMPPDLKDRLMDYSYQEAFDRLPKDIRSKAHDIALIDPLIQRAREIDARGRIGKP